MKNNVVFFLVLFSFLKPLSLFSLMWPLLRQLETEHFIFVFESKNEIFVQELLQSAEDLYTELEELMGYSPGRVYVRILDDRDRTNGTYFPVSRHIALYVSSPFTDSLFSGSGKFLWAKDVLRHELTHYFHLGRRTGPFGLLSYVFGDLYVGIPGAFTPPLIIEGMGVLTETALEEGHGRGNSPFFTMAYKAPLYEKRFPRYGQVRSPSYYLPYDSAYVYGYSFMDYLYRLGGDQGIQLLSEVFNRLTYFPFLLEGPSLRSTYGAWPSELWGQMKNDLEQRFEKDFAIPDGKRLHRGFQEQFYRPFRTQRGILSLRDDFYQGLSFGFWDENFLFKPFLRIGNIQDSSGYTVSSDGNILVFTSLASAWSSDFSLVIYQEGRGLRRVQSQENLFTPSVSPDGRHLLAVSRKGSYHRLWHLDPQGSREERLLWDPEQTRILDMVFSPDGKSLVMKIHEGLLTHLVLFETEEDSQGFFTLKRKEDITRNASMQYDPNFIDNERITFSSSHEGSLFLYEYHLVHRQLKRILRDPVGVLSGIPYREGFLYASYTSDGFALKYKEMDQLETVSQTLSEEDSSLTRAVYVFEENFVESQTTWAWPFSFAYYIVPVLENTSFGSLLGVTVGTFDRQSFMNYFGYINQIQFSYLPTPGIPQQPQLRFSVDYEILPFWVLHYSWESSFIYRPHNLSVSNVPAVFIRWYYRQRLQNLFSIRYYWSMSDPSLKVNHFIIPTFSWQSSVNLRAKSPFDFAYETDMELEEKHITPGVRYEGKTAAAPKDFFGAWEWGASLRTTTVFSRRIDRYYEELEYEKYTFHRQRYFFGIPTFWNQRLLLELEHASSDYLANEDLKFYMELYLPDLAHRNDFRWFYQTKGRLLGFGTKYQIPVAALLWNIGPLLITSASVSGFAQTFATYEKGEGVLFAKRVYAGVETQWDFMFNSAALKLTMGLGGEYFYQNERWNSSGEWTYYLNFKIPYL